MGVPLHSLRSKEYGIVISKGELENIGKHYVWRLIYLDLLDLGDFGFRHYY